MKWYNGNTTLSHNCLFNFIIGSRGVGKTYWSKKWQVKNFLKNKGQFVYVRRYKEELKGDSLEKYFDVIKHEFQDTTFNVKGKTFYINGEVAGFAIPLSTALNKKSTEYPNVTSITFDEFLIEKGTYHYLQKEVEKFLGLYETVARMRENVIVFFLANATTVTNPYFLYFNIKLPYGSTFYKKGDILFEYINNEEYLEEKSKTRFAQIIQGTDYAGYSIENKFLLDQTSLIEKKSGRADFMFSMTYNGYKLGVWISWSDGKLWVSYDIADHNRLHYAITLEDHSENTVLIKALYKNSSFKTFLESYRIGKVYFEDMNIKNITYEIIRATMSI